jgi:hypothetical protein
VLVQLLECRARKKLLHGIRLANGRISRSNEGRRQSQRQSIHYLKVRPLELLPLEHAMHRYDRPRTKFLLVIYMDLALQLYPVGLER